LAGGEGKRLKPLTQKRPKPLIPVAGKPCIDYVLRSLASSGFKEIVITTSYLSDKLIKSIGGGVGYNASILYSFEENPAGTAGAVKRVGNFIDDTFVVAMGDVLADVDVRNLYDYHKSKGAVATLALTEVSDPTDFGIVGLKDDSRIVRFKEKPSLAEAFSNLVNAGIYVLEPEVLDFIPEDGAYDFSKDIFPKLLAKGLPLYGKRLDGVWMDIGRPQDLLRASLEVIRRNGKTQRIAGVDTEGPIILGKDVTIESDVIIRGPCFLADGVRIGHRVVLEGSCLYEDVFIDSEVSLRNCIVMEGTRVGPKSELKESLISSNCTIEEDVNISNTIIGDDMTVKVHSRLENANVSPPVNEH